MQYARTIAHVVHIFSRGHNFMPIYIPVTIFRFFRPSMSSADCTSPMYILFDERGCVKTASQGLYYSSTKLSNINIIILKRITSGS
jgi:hypothetical protein